MTKSYGTPGERARQQAEKRREKREEMERLERREQGWDGGAAGEESTGAWIDRRCPSAVVLHDRRMPNSRANVDHIVVVPSGVWVIDSKRPKGQIKVEAAKDGTDRLLINGNDQTALVHKLTAQVNAVKAVLAEAAPQVVVHGAFCFHLQVNHKRELLNPFLADNGLPLLRALTINGYPLFYPRQMCRHLNSAGTLSVTGAEELGVLLAKRFPPALATSTAANKKRPPPTEDVPAARDDRPSRTTTNRLPKDEYKAMKEAEQVEEWEHNRPSIEEALGRPVPTLVTERLRSDGAIFCHHALWHSRVYLACVHARVGESFTWQQAWAVVASLHHGRTFQPHWLALNGFSITSEPTAT